MAKKVKPSHDLTATADSLDVCNMIDLGLPSGTLWADRNIGASKPEEYGHYFAWGEVEPKYGDYTWETYTYLDNTKICRLQTMLRLIHGAAAGARRLKNAGG